jgi:TonB family protein
MRQIVGASREQRVETVLGIRMRRAHGDSLAAEARRGKGNEQALDRDLPVGQVAEPGVDHRPAGQSERFEPPDGSEVSPWCEGLKAPERIRHVFPDYPESARAARRGGQVTLDVHILEDGAIGAIWVIRPLSPDLDAAAVKAIRQWRYRPATCGDTRVPLDTVVDVSFSVQ